MKISRIVIATCFSSVFLFFGPIPNQLRSQSIELLEQPTMQAIQQAKTFHAQTESLAPTVDSIERKKKIYDSMAKQMEPTPEFDHLPFPTTDPEREWTQKAAKVATGIKPNINYQVVKGRTDAVIYGSAASTKNLRENVRLIAWYRDQLDQNYSNERYNEGPVAIAKLIDDYFDELGDSLPEIKVRKQGRLNLTRDQKIDLSNQDIWGIMSVINRYFFYKTQIRPNDLEYAKADFLLVDAMVKTAALYGSEPPRLSLSKIEVALPTGARTDGWKSAANDALDCWEKELKKEHDVPQVLCEIIIPKKAAPPAMPKPPEGSFPKGVEDIRELGGKIYIKRNGTWELLKK